MITQSTLLHKDQLQLFHTGEGTLKTQPFNLKTFDGDLFSQLLTPVVEANEASQEKPHGREIKRKPCTMLTRVQHWNRSYTSSTYAFINYE